MKKATRKALMKSNDFPWEEQDMHTNLNGYSPCPVCDGDGLEAVEVFKSQSFSRDTGEPYEELRHCETCDGSGEVMLEDK